MCLFEITGACNLLLSRKFTRIYFTCSYLNSCLAGVGIYTEHCAHG